MFTIGNSVTTGRNNVIVWNGIHHKTKIGGGSSNYGWPVVVFVFRCYIRTRLILIESDLSLLQREFI